MITTTQPVIDVEMERQRRLASEVDARDPELGERRHARTLRALADVDAGRVLEDAAMRAWADSLGTDRELPVPQPDSCGYAGPPRRGPTWFACMTTWRT